MQVDKNTLFMLNNQEFTFEVALSSMACGFNAALYFVGMTANQGGAENGTNYCDAQARLMQLPVTPPPPCPHPAPHPASRTPP